MLMAGWSIQLLYCFRIKATLTCLIKALTLLSEDIQTLKLPLTAPRGTHTGGWPLVLLHHLQGDCVHLFVVAGSHGKHHYNAYPLWKVPCFSSKERSLCFLQWWGTTLSQSLLMTHSGITPLVCRKVLSSPLIQSFLDCLCELVTGKTPRKKAELMSFQKGRHCWLPETLHHGLCTPVLPFCSLLPVCKCICSHTLGGIQCTHPWASSTHLHRKAITCCFLHLYKHLPATPPLHSTL